MLSTLQRYVRATGAELALVVLTRDGNDIVLHSLGDLSAGAKAAPKPKKAESTKRPRRNSARQIA